MVVTDRSSNFNLLLSTSKVSWSTKEQPLTLDTGNIIVEWYWSGGKTEFMTITWCLFLCQSPFPFSWPMGWKVFYYFHLFYPLKVLMVITYLMSIRELSSFMLR